MHAQGFVERGTRGERVLVGGNAKGHENTV
jgi:hypothetical protein